ncbi:MAG TPA: heme-binding protein [Caulobacteraceae bacterium]|jgi:uncharacterized protein GlcG (DUF336 family)|nr:heme-binding protein [Caulobacteraceae bacterium]
MKSAALGFALALVASGAALAQAPAGPPRPPGPPARGPSAAVAVELAQDAIAACAANGYKVTAVVLNSAGMQRVQISSDGAPDMTGPVGLRKAFTVITFGQPSGAVGDKAKTDAALADRLKSDPKLIGWAGGEPLTAGGQVIGALGVSGAPGGDKDDACANAAIAKVGGRLS